MEPNTILLLLMKLALAVHDESQAPVDYVFFEEGQRITINGYFEGLQKLILCDSEIYSQCTYLNEQRILLKGQTQILIEISVHPWYFGDRIYFHPLGRDGPLSNKGYQFIIGQIYDKAVPIDWGME